MPICLFARLVKTPKGSARGLRTTKSLLKKGNCFQQHPITMSPSGTRMLRMQHTMPLVVYQIGLRRARPPPFENHMNGCTHGAPIQVVGTKNGPKNVGTRLGYKRFSLLLSCIHQVHTKRMHRGILTNYGRKIASKLATVGTMCALLVMGAGADEVNHSWRSV